MPCLGTMYRFFREASISIYPDDKGRNFISQDSTHLPVHGNILQHIVDFMVTTTGNLNL
jgi:hypothetical protein